MVFCLIATIQGAIDGGRLTSESLTRGEWATFHSVRFHAITFPAMLVWLDCVRLVGVSHGGAEIDITLVEIWSWYASCARCAHPHPVMPRSSDSADFDSHLSPPVERDRIDPNRSVGLAEEGSGQVLNAELHIRKTRVRCEN